MKVQNNVFGKSQDYNTTISRQEKRKRAESQLKKVLDKKKILAPPTTHSSAKYSTQWLYYELLLPSMWVAEMVEYVRKCVDGISQNLQSLSPY